MATKRPASPGELVEQQFAEHFECCICTMTEVLDMRLLPCQHRLCTECLESILCSTKQCPECRDPLTKSRASRYPICRLTAKIWQDITRLKEDLSKTQGKKKLCSTAACDRPIDQECTKCKLEMCYQCSKSKCIDSATGAHDLIERNEEEELLKQAKVESWQMAKRRKITELEEERSEHVKYVKKTMASMNDSNFLQAMSRVRSKEAKVEELSKEIEKAKAELANRTMDDGEDSDAVDQDCVAGLLCDLSMDGKSYSPIELKYGEYVNGSGTCYSVDKSPNDGIIFGCDEGFIMLTQMGKKVKDVQPSTYSCVMSIQCYNRHLYTLCKDNTEPGRRIVVYDLGYREVQRFPVLDYQQISQMAVCNDKIYVSNPDNKEICVYSTKHGEQRNFSTIRDDTFHTPAFLSQCPPHSILISDPHGHRVHKVNCMDDKVTWTSSVVAIPVGICCDQNLGIWVWCHKDSCLNVLNSQTGEMKQKVYIGRGCRLETIYDLHIRDRKVWVAAWHQGLHSFTIN